MVGRGAPMPRIPHDVWAAGVLGVTVALCAVFEPAHVLFAAVFFAVCAYVLWRAFRR